MKKNTFCLACVCMYLLIALSCEIPQSVTVKSSPGLRLPLGSPFVLVKEGERIEDFFNTAEIKKMMGGTSGGVQVFEYTGGTNVTSGAEAHVVVYPITEMKFDFEKYINDKTKDDDTVFTYAIPSFISNLPAGSPGYHLTGSDNPPQIGTPNADVKPLFTVELADMGKLVKEANGGPFGLELDYDPDFENNLEVKIPKLGIDSYIKGKHEGAKLRFYKDGNNTITPKDSFPDGKIEIYVNVTGACSGTIAPDMLFEWTTAVIDTKNEPVTDKFALNNNDLKSFFGDSVKFKQARGYTYVGGLGNSTATMTLKIDGETTPSLVNNESLTEKGHPRFSEPVTTIPEDSLAGNFIDLTAVLNSSISSVINLVYELRIDEREVTKDDEGDIIFADLVILLPLEFAVSTPAGGQYAATHAKLELKGLDLNFGDKDLFQRDPENDNNLFENLKSVEVVLSKIKNDILGGEIYLFTGVGNNSDLLYIKEGENPSIKFTGLPNPFIPKFEILIKKDTAGDASFWLKRKVNGAPTFDFSISIQAQADINETIKF